jgi:hypothetical protein
MKNLIRRRKQNPKSKPLPPSKRLRLEAQRVLKERVQDIADKKGIKLRFCNLKECENHIHTIDSPCANIRMEIGWPPGVPFVHPHDLPNKAKLGFLEAYEPGWTDAHQNIDRLVNTLISLTLTILLQVESGYSSLYLYLSSPIVVMCSKFRICIYFVQGNEKVKKRCSSI